MVKRKSMGDGGRRKEIAKPNYYLQLICNHKTINNNSFFSF
jgi:hypothetical protein